MFLPPTSPTGHQHFSKDLVLVDFDGLAGLEYAVDKTKVAESIKSVHLQIAQTWANITEHPRTDYGNTELEVAYSLTKPGLEKCN